MTCPICLSVDDSPLVAGMRAGALVLFLMASIVIATAARFAWRLWMLERETERPSATVGDAATPDAGRG